MLFSTGSNWHIQASLCIDRLHLLQKLELPPRAGSQMYSTVRVWSESNIDKKKIGQWFLKDYYYEYIFLIQCLQPLYVPRLGLRTQWICVKRKGQLIQEIVGNDAAIGLGRAKGFAARDVIHLSLQCTNIVRSWPRHYTGVDQK